MISIRQNLKKQITIFLFAFVVGVQLQAMKHGRDEEVPEGRKKRARITREFSSGRTWSWHSRRQPQLQEFIPGFGLPNEICIAILSKLGAAGYQDDLTLEDHWNALVATSTTCKLWNSFMHVPMFQIEFFRNLVSICSDNVFEQIKKIMIKILFCEPLQLPPLFIPQAFVGGVTRGLQDGINSDRAAIRIRMINFLSCLVSLNYSPVFDLAIQAVKQNGFYENPDVRICVLRLLNFCLSRNLAIEESKQIALQNSLHDNTQVRKNALNLLNELVDDGYVFDGLGQAAFSNAQDGDIKVREHALELLEKLVERGLEFEKANKAAKLNRYCPLIDFRLIALNIFSKLVQQNYQPSYNPARRAVEHNIRVGGFLTITAEGLRQLLVARNVM